MNIKKYLEKIEHFITTMSITLMILAIPIVMSVNHFTGR